MSEHVPSEQLESLRRLLGEIRGEPVNDWESMVKVFHRGLFSHKFPKIAVTGLHASGKATLLKALFGITFQGSPGNPDYKNVVIVHKLASGVEILDTPSIGPDHLIGEQITRLFFSLSPLDGEPIEKIHVLDIEKDQTESRKVYPLEVARERLKDVDIILFILDAKRELVPEITQFLQDLKAIHHTKPLIVVVNKTDALSPEESHKKLDEIIYTLADITKDVVPIAAHNNSNISLLSSRIVHLLPIDAQREFFQKLSEENRKVARDQLLQNLIISAAAKVATLKAEQKNILESVLLGLTEEICQSFGFSMQEAATKFGISGAEIENQARRLDSESQGKEGHPKLFKDISQEGSGSNLELATGSAGFVSGAVTGAVVGSFIPVPIVGTLIGAIAGGVFGLGLGSALGEGIGSATAPSTRSDDPGTTHPSFTSAMLVYAYGQFLFRFLNTTTSEAQEETKTFDLAKAFTDELKEAKSVFSNIRGELEAETDYQVAVYLLTERIRQEQLILRCVYETAISDGHFSAEERAYLDRLARQSKLNPDVFKYISRNEILEGVKKISQDEAMRTRLLEKVRVVALRDQVIHPEEWTFLGKIYKVLGMDPDKIQKDAKMKKKSDKEKDDKWKDQHQRAPFSVS